jgi:Fe-S cluster assembly protein SufB
MRSGIALGYCWTIVGDMPRNWCPTLGERSDTYPTINVANSSTTVQHEATVSKVGEDQLFYLMSRGISENEATAMVVNGFVEPITKEIPLEYAVELNRLIELQMEGSIG